MLITVYASPYLSMMFIISQPVTMTILCSVIDAWIVRKLLMKSLLNLSLKIFLTGKGQQTEPQFNFN